jgi:hypothetical protein
VRLPGWTGGRGFFLGDGDFFIVVQGDIVPPPVWQPAILHGSWRDDEYGTFWYQAESIQPVQIEERAP